MQEYGASNSQDNNPGNSSNRPPRPGSPGSPNKPNKQDKQDKKPGKIRKQAMPVLVMLGLIAASLVVYSGVRAAREAIGPQAANSITLPKEIGTIKIGLPEGWKDARMQNVAKASGRWGLGKPGSTKYAFFVTRYPLRAIPKNTAQLKQVLSEAQQSMKQTGAQNQQLKRISYKQGDLSGWQYHFKVQGIDVKIWLILHNANDRSALYQFACQSPIGNKGKPMRNACQQSIDGVKFSNDHA